MSLVHAPSFASAHHGSCVCSSAACARFNGGTSLVPSMTELPWIAPTAADGAGAGTSDRSPHLRLFVPESPTVTSSIDGVSIDSVSVALCDGVQLNYLSPLFGAGKCDLTLRDCTLSGACAQLAVPFRVRAVAVENAHGLKYPCKLRVTFALATGGFLVDRSRIVTTASDAVEQAWDMGSGHVVTTGSARWNDGFAACDVAVSTLSVVRRCLVGGWRARCTHTHTIIRFAPRRGKPLLCFANLLLVLRWLVPLAEQFTRLVITVGVVASGAEVPASQESDVMIGCVSLGLFDARRRLRSGRWALRMFTNTSSESASDRRFQDGFSGEETPPKQFMRNVPVAVAAGE